MMSAMASRASKRLKRTENPERPCRYHRAGLLIERSSSATKFLMVDDLVDDVPNFLHARCRPSGNPEAGRAPSSGCARHLHADGGAGEIQGPRDLSEPAPVNCTRSAWDGLQYSALLVRLSVRDNLALPLEELFGKSSDEIDDAVEEKLGLVECQTRADRAGRAERGMKKTRRWRCADARSGVVNFEEPGAGPIRSSARYRRVDHFAGEKNGRPRYRHA